MGTQNLWVHKICDDTKFQVSGREYQNICVLCISCEQKTYVLFPYMLFAICELALTEPRCEKTGLRGFQPGRTQTGLYSHRIWLEA